MGTQRDAAVLTIGTELTEGLRYDTNSHDIAHTLSQAGYTVRELVSLPDREEDVAAGIARLLDAYDLVVATGGLGPTHDDITRNAAARVVGKALVRDARIEAGLRRVAERLTDAVARERLYVQADVIEGARSLPSGIGTAPGMVVEFGAGTLVLLPGPPREMRPMLESFLEGVPVGLQPLVLGCAGVIESEVQSRVLPVVERFERIDLTLLANERGVDVILISRGGDAEVLAAAGRAARSVLGDDCYSTDGSSLSAVVVDAARTAGLHLASAESCTGGMVAGAITDTPGASDVFVGSVVAYANDVKRSLLSVPAEVLERQGAVSGEVALAMAEGALRLTGADVSVATTGIAGPGGGSADKPVGLVWFAVASSDGRHTVTRREFLGDREAVRARATTTSLDQLRRFMLGG